jgi:hypothetical protein
MPILRALLPNAFLLSAFFLRTVLLSAFLLGAFLFITIMPPSTHAEDGPWAEPLPSASLQNYTGLWDMPSARVLPDWHIRAFVSDSGPYRSYGGAAGLFDRLEIHGRVTEVGTRQGFEIDEGFGDFKDRSLGARLVLIEEDKYLPQLAVGLYDIEGTGIFASRYVVASKRIGPADFSFGLGQGILAGEDISDPSSPELLSGNAGSSFHSSSPFRRTKAFAGLDLEFLPHVHAVIEYSSMDYDTLFGYEGEQHSPMNLGIKYDITEYLQVQGAYMRGRDLAWGAGLSLPLKPEGLFTWLAAPSLDVNEKERIEALRADNEALAVLLSGKLKEDGFRRVRAVAADTALWIEVAGGRYLADARSFGRVGALLDDMAPPRIKTVYINLVYRGQVRQSMKTSREHLRAFLESRIDAETFLAFADVELYDDKHREEFLMAEGRGPVRARRDSRWSFDVEPKIETFTENREGFIKNKGFLRFSAGVEPWTNSLVLAEAELTLFNEFDDLNFPQLEDNAARTDITAYEDAYGLRITQLAFNQIHELPWKVLLSTSFGAFESAYAGISAETFRFFADGRLGLGLESQALRKRDPDHPIGLASNSTHIFSTAFLNLYAQPSPALGIETGLKVGRFLGGDWGGRFELRRTWKHFTLGGWFTWTDTSGFESEKNRGHREKGLFIRVPLSIFRREDAPGHFRYQISSFTRDAGQTAARPVPLFPVDNEGLPAATQQSIEEMRHR